ncbi:hypothetical protein YTPLAS72_29390 [Nitrospira sp.]|nr:hypothetical protein YTPLAS72_29390 [Nitrospira sp.]
MPDPLLPLLHRSEKGKVDERALAELIEWQIAKGTSGIVPCGTTGESATLSHDEHNRVIELTVEVVRRRVPVIAGTGSNSTDEAITPWRDTRREAGVDGALLITPYYNKPTQEGLYRHYKAIAEAVDLPLVLQHSWSDRCEYASGNDCSAFCVQTIIGVKEGSDLSNKLRILCRCVATVLRYLRG